MAMTWEKASPTKCLYCGKALPWWLCDCPPTVEIRAGKRPKPRIIDNRPGFPLIFAYDPDLKLPIVGQGGGGSFMAAPTVTPVTPVTPPSVTKTENVTPTVTLDAKQRNAERQKRWRDRKKQT